VVADADSLLDTSTVVITEPFALVAATSVDSNATCNGFSNGGATASGSGGNSGYNYDWSNGSITASISGVPAGNYSVIVTDTNGCMDSSSVSITEPTELIAEVTLNTPISCYGFEDGSASASATGGTSGYAYAWNNSDTTSSITGLATGTYTVSITDVNGCLSENSIQLDQPDPLTLTLDDTIQLASEFLSSTPLVAPSGYSTYSWSTGSTDSTTIASGAGWHYLTVTDSNDCEAYDSIYVVITVGMANIPNQNSITIFPNPADQEVKIRINNNIVPDRVQVISLEGRTMMSKRQTGILDISHLSSGIYIMNVEYGEERWNRILTVN
jgi:hypothetical protein